MPFASPIDLTVGQFLRIQKNEQKDKAETRTKRKWNFYHYKRVEARRPSTLSHYRVVSEESTVREKF